MSGFPASTTTFVSRDAASHVRVDEHHFDSFVYFGARDAEGPGPQMYLNSVDAGVELAAHFHRVDQFQVFFGSPGAMFLRHPIPNLMVHYTDAYSTYGPFRSGPEAPLDYVTIRARASNFGGVMPGARAQLPYRGRRNLSVDVDDWPANSAEHDGSAVPHHQVLLSDGDGLRVEFVCLGSGASVWLETPSESSGRACCVANGDISVFGESYGSRSLGWSDATAAGLEVTAGVTGASLLLLSFPSPPSDVARLGADAATQMS